MFNLAILMWLMIELNAPNWCYICWWITAILKVLNLIIECIKIGKEL